MALITISGFPCAGKSHRTDQLAAFLRNKISQDDYTGPFKNVLIISDHSLGLSPAAYDDSKSEKPARGALFTAMQRQLATDTLLIVDSLNYIKGFRYQMYCAAREFKLRTCTLYVVANPDLCRERNSSRPPSDAYAPSTQDTTSYMGYLENLFMRYEEPSSMVRWDAPLITVLWDEADIPGDQVWDAINKGNVKPPNSGTLSNAKAPADALQTLEKVTAAITTAVASESSSQSSGSTMVVSVGDAQVSINLPGRNITLSELQRHRRQFVSVHKKAITLGTTERGGVDWSEENIGVKFGTYLEEHL